MRVGGRRIGRRVFGLHVKVAAARVKGHAAHTRGHDLATGKCRWVGAWRLGRGWVAIAFGWGGGGADLGAGRTRTRQCFM